MKFFKWEDAGRKMLLVRIACKHCATVNVCEGFDNAFFWQAVKERPAKERPCDKCQMRLYLRYTREGVEYMM